ncbi:transcription termination factor Rho [Coraliomargarita sp. SDUM461003]|uniref:Transcription termination factor Rho n=1 Tax=Thalassobacterium maritimum TaxID=3041265 RepID=A0ABU1APN3_9BACT|nr:transcription termination factor Rho [Coraliomargarita sp. SDUM461003]MDQ8206110.1 transcription termination factor Rho [Coraliomargarita sp. SDUM461003]
MSQDNSSTETPAPTEEAVASATPKQEKAQQNKQPSKEKPQVKEVAVSGILEILENKTGQLIDPSRNGKTKPNDPFVPRELIKRFKLKQGSFIEGNAHQNDRFPNPKVRFIEKVDGAELEERKGRYTFQQMVSIAPDEQIRLEAKDGRVTTRIMDLFCPIGKGTRGLIVAPPRTGKTTLLHDIAHGVIENHPECHCLVLLVDERPEEVTDFKRSVNAEIYASSNDEDLKNHLRIAEITIERAKRLVEAGKDVVLLLDSITRLARAYNAASGKGGRTMTGGLDVRALEKPRQIFSAARNCEEGGSLTIIATALIETGSKMDELIFQEFKGTGNMEMVLDRKAAELRLWPAINLNASGTRKEELLLSGKYLEGAQFLRRALAGQKIEDAAELMIDRFQQTKTNDEFLKLLQR